MGEKGRITRLAGHLFGNYLMYAPLDLRGKTAEGQVNVKELTNFQNLIK
jgi:3-dehydroquinate dehydratase